MRRRDQAFKITVSESIVVRRPPEVVWDFTQDYGRRTTWDASVREAVVLARDPAPRVRVRCAGGVRAVFHYKQFDRPSRTSLALEEVESFLIDGGGGAWSYLSHDGGTRWTQTNTLTLRPGRWRRILAPLLRHQLRSSTRRAMKKARALLEAEG